MTEENVIYNVPYRAQRTGSTCVPTCLGMLMEFEGLNISQDLIDDTALRNGRGIYGHHKGLLETAREFGFAPSSEYLKGADAFQNLLEILRTQPLLVTGQFQHFWEKDERSGHALVVIGFDSATGAVIYHDPHHRKAADGLGRQLSMGAEEFADRWSQRHMGWCAWLHSDLLRR